MFKATLGIIQLACLTLAVFPGATRAAAPNSIQIEGDRAVFDQTSRNIIYSGSVIATQGDLMIAGDELTVALVDDDVDTIRTIGAPAKFSLRQAARDGEEQGRKGESVTLPVGRIHKPAREVEAGLG